MLNIKNGVVEEGYDIADEAKLSSIFGIGNGYFGLRGSLEEFGDVFIQGLYIRGVFDQIVEIPSTFSDNVYMKNYYFDGQKLKEFEKEDSCINICDPIQVRVYVSGVQLLPWTHEILSWKRYIDMETGCLVREVVYEDKAKNQTKVIYKRFASFADNHLLAQEVEIEKLNHDLETKVLAGVDTLVKTNGQHKSVVTRSENRLGAMSLRFFMGDKYHQEVALESHNETDGLSFETAEVNDGFYFSAYLMSGKKAAIKKIVTMYASVDPVLDIEKAALEDNAISYEDAYAKHLAAFKDAFSKIDIKINDSPEIDGLLRYADFQTLIGFDRYDSVHSLSAKNLTAEKYNQFVWWDAEIFNLPILLSSFPEAARSCLEYRYRSLPEARKIAEKDGYRGAKFAFCSSVKGDENVWIYARHPFLQIHISGDVAYGVINYYHYTHDEAFMKEKGLEMILEVIRYFASRSTLEEDGLYHLLNVTGTDEHHPYVNDDAYTNYEVRFIAQEFKRLAKEFGLSLTEQDRADMSICADKFFVPSPNEDGLIPQFEGYFSLNPELELKGNGAAKGFQMKASGLYHLSQVIKQPDVLNLFTYLSIGMDSGIYKKNFDFYYGKCESSSSLSYPVHALGALQNGEYDLFLKNFYDCLTVDLLDIFKGAYQGVHAGCIAGGYYNVFRGIFGIDPKGDALYVNPIFDSPFKDIEMQFTYRGETIRLTMKEGKLVLSKTTPTKIRINHNGIDKWLIDHLEIN